MIEMKIRILTILTLFLIRCSTTGDWPQPAFSNETPEQALHAVLVAGIRHDQGALRKVTTKRLRKQEEDYLRSTNCQYDFYWLCHFSMTGCVHYLANGKKNNAWVEWKDQSETNATALIRFNKDIGFMFKFIKTEDGWKWNEWPRQH